MTAKGKQDTATMPPAEREAIEGAEMRAQFGPLLDLYGGFIELILGQAGDEDHEGAALVVYERLRDAVAEVVAVRKKLGLAQRNETRALTAFRHAVGG